MHYHYTQNRALSVRAQTGNPIFAVDLGKGELMSTIVKRSWNPEELHGESLVLSGKKKYLCASYEDFLEHYNGLKWRHYYEVLLPDRPCHLYIDAEFHRGTNPSKDPMKVRDEFIRELEKELVSKGYIKDIAEEMRVIDLDSSTQDRVSRHFIIKLRGKRWVNNFHCGAFMRSFHMRLYRERFGDFFFWGRKEENFVYDSQTHNMVFYADMGVYTLHRLFRLYGSSKVNHPEDVFLFSGQSAFDPSLFTDTLVQYPGAPGEELLVCADWNGSDAMSTSNKRFFLTKPPPVEKRKHSSSSQGEDRPSKYPKSNAEAMFNAAKGFLSMAEDIPMHAIKIQGLIKESNILLVATQSKRCEIAQRVHTGNHVYYLINLNEGFYYQKCHSLTPPCCPIAKSPIKVIRDKGFLEAIEDWRNACIMEIADEILDVFSNIDTADDSQFSFSLPSSLPDDEEDLTDGRIDRRNNAIISEDTIFCASDSDTTRQHQ